MAVEARRGCGYRKIGGLYLAGGGVGVPCDRLPLALTVCPVCSGGIKQTRAWTWIDVNGLVQGPHTENERPCRDRISDRICPFCTLPSVMGKAGLLWIGERFYPTPADFLQEGRDMGFSRRIKSVPRGFKLGETWVLLAHPKAVRTEVDAAIDELKKGGPAFVVGNPTEGFSARKVEMKPGVFYVWQPTRLEKILPESDRGTDKEKDLTKQGMTCIFVPDDDRDHQGSVYDKDKQLELEEA